MNESHAYSRGRRQGGSPHPGPPNGLREDSPAPLILTFLAPATQCNQRCPRCVITELLHEPVTKAALVPGDYVRFASQFEDVGATIASIGFLGYEVTLPESWPYVEALFAFAQQRELRRSLVTNGMLLDRWTNRIVDLDVNRVSISLDGSNPASNDRIRGLSGAFAATVRSTRRFLEAAPAFRDRVAIASCVHDEANFRSLLDMPALLKSLGIRRWLLSTGLVADSQTAAHLSEDLSTRWLCELADAAEASDIDAYVIDPPGSYRNARVQRLRTAPLDRLYRLDPAGYVRSGAQLLDVFNPDALPRWNPTMDFAPALAGYVHRSVERADGSH